MDILSISGSFFKVDSDNDYYFIVGNSGCVILEKEFYGEVGYIVKSGGFTDVGTSLDSIFIYLTTSGEGIYILEKNLINNVENLSNKIGKKFEHFLRTNDILCIDIINDSTLAFGTISGLQYIINEDIYESTYYKPVTSIKLTMHGDIYYGGSFGLSKKAGPIVSDWDEPDFTLTTSSIPHLTSINVNDIDVLSCSGYNLLSLATNSGVTILKELPYVETSSILSLYRS